MKHKYFTALRKDGEWEKTDKRGYKDLFYAHTNAIQISMRGGGTEVAIIHNGKIRDIFLNGKIKEPAEHNGGNYFV